MTAEPIVLVPGLLCTEALFAPQIALLSQTRSVQVADHRQDASIAAIAERLIAQSPPRFALAGLSMGGYIALEVLRQAPERVTRLALLDTSARADTAAQTSAREERIALARSGRFEAVKSALAARFVAQGRREDAALQRVIAGMMEATGPETYMRQERAIMGRPDSRASLAAIEIPTLVLVGDDDELTPPDLSREIGEAIEWSSVVVVPECGHLPTLERPEATNEALEAWLAT